MYNKTIRYNSKSATIESLIRIHLALHKIDITNQQLKCLVIFVVMGITEDSYNFILAKKIVPKKEIINNYKTLLKDKGLLVKLRSNIWQVCDDLQIDVNLKKFEIKVDIINDIAK